MLGDRYREYAQSCSIESGGHPTHLESFSDWKRSDLLTGVGADLRIKWVLLVLSTPVDKINLGRTKAKLERE